MIPLTILLSACAQEVPQQSVSEKAQDQTPAAIEVYEIHSETFSETIRATGTIAAKQTSRIGPLVEGVLETVYVRVGDRPRKGDPLFKMRTEEYQQAVDQAQAQLLVAQAEMQLSVKKLSRAKELRRDNLLSQDDLDLTETSARVAQARYKSAKALLASAQQNLRDTIVVAPFDGTITGRFSDEGVYMSNRFSTGGQSSVVELSEAEIVAGIMRVPEAQLSKLKLGQRAILYPAGSDQGYESEVFIINDRVDPTTRTAEFRLPVKNDDYTIKPGQFTSAEVFVEPRDLIKVPRSAVNNESASTTVFIRQNTKWIEHPVKVKAFDDEHFEVLEGLVAGQEIALVANTFSLDSLVDTQNHVDH